MQMTRALPDNVCRQLWQNKEHRLSRHCAREETQLDSCRPLANGWPLPAALMQSSRISSEVVDPCAGLTNIRQTPTSSPLDEMVDVPPVHLDTQILACAQQSSNGEEARCRSNSTNCRVTDNGRQPATFRPMNSL
ncbi:hypothetical protein C0Q70_10425 [Pomacea canaliculata]|uniref:Uncharacterized protein n=1 Tax=Pomacea canaliculata TaxID=400727 RepID=A0A2T7PCK7_POMCA|nr:hypothetical protein C0Q70_10425 [Pomacea canaliculata]